MRLPICGGKSVCDLSLVILTGGLRSVMPLQKKQPKLHV